MAVPELVRLRRLETFGGGYWTAPTWTQSNVQAFAGDDGSRTDYDIGLFTCQILKQDFTGVDPLSVTLNEAGWVEFATGPPVNEPGWANAPSYMAARAFYKFHDRGSPQDVPSGSHTGGFIKGRLSGVKNVAEMAPTDVSMTLSPLNFSGTVSVTSSVTGLAIHFSSLAGPGVDEVVTVGGTATFAQSNSIRNYYLLCTFRGQESGWGVGTINW